MKFLEAEMTWSCGRGAARPLLWPSRGTRPHQTPRCSPPTWVSHWPNAAGSPRPREGGLAGSLSLCLHFPVCEMELIGTTHLKPCDDPVRGDACKRPSPQEVFARCSPACGYCHPGSGGYCGETDTKAAPPCPGGMRTSGKKRSHFHSEPGSSTLGPSCVGNRHLSWGTDSSDSWGWYRGLLRLACWVSLG